MSEYTPNGHSCQEKSNLMGIKKLSNEPQKRPYKGLGNKLGILRGNINKRAFAKELGVAYNTYLRYEKGMRKIPDGLFRLAEILAQQANKKDGTVRESRGLYFSTQELEIDGKKHVFKLHLPDGEPQKLPPPDMAVQNALKMIEGYVKELRERDAEIAELKISMALLEKKLAALIPGNEAITGHKAT